MEQSLSEANSHSASQEIHSLLWNPKVPYRGHKGPPLVPIPSQMHPAHIFTPYFAQIRCNIISHLPRSSERSSHLRFCDKIIYAYLISPMCATCSANFVLQFGGET